MIRFLLPLLLLGACTARDDMLGTAPPPPNSALIYETTPCFGTCPVYRVVLAELTGNSFIGEQHVAAIGVHRFVDKDAPARVKALLAPWRPNGSVHYAPGEKNCADAPTDMPSVRVIWAEGEGHVTGEIDFYYGCAAANPELAAALRKVPNMLPIAGLIGKR